MLKYITSNVLRRPDAVIFAGGTVGLQAATIICMFIALRWIPPLQMGIWATVQLFFTYGMISRLGVLNGMNREFPFEMGRGNKDAAIAAAQTAQFYSLVNGLVFSVGFLVAAVIPWFEEAWWQTALLTMAVFAPLKLYATYLEGTFRGDSEFQRLGTVKFCMVGVHILTVPLYIVYGFTGFCIRELVITGMIALLYHSVRPVRAAPRFDWNVLLRLISVGIPLHFSNYLQNLAQTFPRLILLSMGGVVWVGLFVPVGAALNAFRMLTTTLAAYAYPKLTYRYGQSEFAVGRTAVKLSLALMICLTPAVIAGWFIVDFLIQGFLPKYAQAIPAVRVALLAGLVESTQISTIAFGAAKAWRWMSIFVVWNLVIRFIGPCAGYFLMDDKLYGVALGVLASSLVMAGIRCLIVSQVKPESQPASA